MGDAPERGRYAPFRVAEQTVVCSGDLDQGWYRASNIFGYTTVEWPADRKPPIPDLGEVTKPTHHNCTCWVSFPKFVTLGRYGSWDKSKLSHTAFYQIAEGVR
jgi:hypothetical protein